MGALKGNEAWGGRGGTSIVVGWWTFIWMDEKGRKGSLIAGKLDLTELLYGPG